MWDDFSFEAISRETSNINEANKFEIEIYKQDPLYLHFNKRLRDTPKIYLLTLFLQLLQNGLFV